MTIRLVAVAAWRQALPFTGDERAALALAEAVTRGPVEEFQRKSAVLDAHCVAIGRDPTTIERSVQVRVDSAELGAVHATLRSFIAAGATHLVLNLVVPYPEGIVQRLVDEVESPLRAEHEGGAQR